MRRLRAILGSLVLSCVLLAPGTSFADDARESTLQRTLPNGLRVFVRRDQRTSLVAITTIYQVGAAQDPDGQRGMAKVISQILPRLETRHIALQDQVRLFQAAGLEWWEPKASASDERTVVSVRVPARARSFALWLEAERMGFMSDGVTGEIVDDGEQEVAKQEEQRRDSAGKRMDAALELAGFGPTSVYAKSLKPPQLAAIDAASVQQRLRSHYTPANAYLVVVGDVDPEATLSEISRYYGRLKGTPVPELLEPPHRVGKEAVRIAGPADAEVAGLAFNSAKFLTQDDLTLDVLARYLGIVLARDLVQADLARGIYTRQISKRLSSAYVLGSVLKPGKTPHEWRALTEAALERVQQGNISSADFESAKASIIASIAAGNDGLLETAVYIGLYARTVNDPDYAPRYFEGYRKVTPAMLSDVARRYLRREQGQLIVGEKTAVSSTSQPDEATGTPPKLTVTLPSQKDDTLWYKPPAVPSATHVALPSIVDDQTSTGERFLFTRRTDAPLVTFRIEVPWKHRLPAWGATQIIRAYTVLPAKGETSLDVKLREIGATLQTSADADSYVALVQAVPERFEQALLLIDQHLRTARFSEGRLEELVQPFREPKRDTIERKAYAWENALTYESAHRYYVPLDANKELAKLTAAKLEAYFRAELPFMRLSIVGDLETFQVRETLERVAKARPRPSKPARQDLYRVAPRPEQRLLLVNDPSAQEIRVTFAFPADSRYGADLARVTALTSLLGYNTVSPSLRSRLRGEGITGDVRMTWMLRPEQNEIRVQVTLKKGQLEAATRALLMHIEALRLGEITPVAVAQARNDADWWLAQKLDSTDGIAQLLQAMNELDATPAAVAKTWRQIGALDKNAMVAAAEEYLQPDKLRVFAYGPVADEAKSVGSQLQTEAHVTNTGETSTP